MDELLKRKIVRQVKLERAARRKAELESGAPRVTAKAFATTKRDKTSRKQVPNTVRRW